MTQLNNKTGQEYTYWFLYHTTDGRIKYYILTFQEMQRNCLNFLCYYEVEPTIH